MNSITNHPSSFVPRHIGPSDKKRYEMLQLFKKENLDEFIIDAAPDQILSSQNLDLPQGLSESEFLKLASEVANKNKVFTSFIGQGYYDAITPTVILRNILESPMWYTAYTPYQAEISQGRMEALLNFQTMVSDLTGMDLANSSLLDEGTAVAEAVTLAKAVQRTNKSNTVFVDHHLFPQTQEVLQTRCKALGLSLKVGDFTQFDFSEPVFACIVQYPSATGELYDLETYRSWTEKCHQHNALVICAADIMSLCLLEAPGTWGADIVCGSTQRFGVPMGFGGPHAAYLATTDKYKRSMPGRIIGVSKDKHNNDALRLALQTREQHIRREKATSNICTAQVLLAVMASMYAVYHGPQGLKKIAQSIHRKTQWVAQALEALGFTIRHKVYFDTLAVSVSAAQKKQIQDKAKTNQINLGSWNEQTLLISIDEAKTVEDLELLISCFSDNSDRDLNTQGDSDLFSSMNLVRSTEFLSHATFNKYHTETELLRYIHRLAQKDLSLTHSMIPLGSCTMKLNSTTEMIPVTWKEFGGIHPFAPQEQTQGYLEMFKELEAWICQFTGFDAVSLQPNAGSQGEYAGLLAIKNYHQANNEGDRNICLIPSSAHGTNPASAVMVGFKVVVIRCDDNGNIDLSDLQDKAEQHRDQLAALMITYPSTHGVFEESIKEICTLIHKNGGQVYLDGANLNALVGIAKPADFGADVAHLNLHKTFCIPHGGGGPGVGPIGVKEHLKNFIPGHQTYRDLMLNDRTSDHLTANSKLKLETTAVAAAPWGSASILPISWAYMKMMGGEGLKLATQTAILNANYIAKRLEGHYPILYRGKNNYVAHECIIDTRNFKDSAGVSVDDIAKRLMDYGYHAPTMSWPVAGTLMIEPTESESKEEIDRFCDAMIAIRQEIADIENHKADRSDNVLKNAPHSLDEFVNDEWAHSYSRQQAAYPLPWVKSHKFWTSVGRVDNAFGDRNLVCTCPSIEDY